MDQVFEQKDPSGGVTQLNYDAKGDLIKVIDPVNHAALSCEYDSANRLQATVDVKTKREAYAYDALGRLTGITDRKGQTTTFGYDNESRLTQVNFSSGIAQSRSHDTLGRLTEITEAGSRISFSYDEFDRLIKEIAETSAGRSEITYVYDNFDRRIKRSGLYNGSPIDETTYQYDNAGRLLSMSYQNHIFVGPLQTTGYAWDAANRLTQKTLPNGIIQIMTYDAANRLTQIQYKYTGGQIIETVNYTYDANGNRIRKTESLASAKETPYTASYDEANRLVQITFTQSNKTYVLSYDDNGNLTQKQNTVNAQDRTLYTWDDRNRLIKIEAPNLSATFGYDVLGRRVARTVNGETTHYLYDGIQAVAEITNRNIRATILTGLAIDEAIARYTASGARSYLTDALGSVIAQTKNDQSTQSRYSYSPYGEVIVSDEDEGNAVEYTSRENDETGLYYYRARYYDPVLKRFVSEDPLGLAAGINLYGYVLQNPISYSDPTGLLFDATGAYTAATGASAAAEGAGIATGASAGVVSAAVLGAAAVGAAIGYGIHKLVEKASGKSIGEHVYDALHPESDPELQKEIEKEANRREYKRICSEPPPPGLSKCELAKWKLRKAKMCKAAREANTDRWWDGVDNRHSSQLAEDLEAAIRNAQADVDRNCGCP